MSFCNGSFNVNKRLAAVCSVALCVCKCWFKRICMQYPPISSICDGAAVAVACSMLRINWQKTDHSQASLKWNGSSHRNHFTAFLLSKVYSKRFSRSWTLPTKFLRVRQKLFIKQYNCRQGGHCKGAKEGRNESGARFLGAHIQCGGCLVRLVIWIVEKEVQAMPHQQKLVLKFLSNTVSPFLRLFKCLAMPDFFSAC